jgi:hypothetical protein
MPANLLLNLLAGRQQLRGLVLGLNLDAGVEKLGLVEHQPNRLGVIHGRTPHDRDAMTGQPLHHRLEVGAAVTDVGAEAQVPTPAHG